VKHEGVPVKRGRPHAAAASALGEELGHAGSRRPRRLGHPRRAGAVPRWGRPGAGPGGVAGSPRRTWGRTRVPAGRAA